MVVTFYAGRMPAYPGKTSGFAGYPGDLTHLCHFYHVSYLLKYHFKHTREVIAKPLGTRASRPQIFENAGRMPALGAPASTPAGAVTTSTEL